MSDLTPASCRAARALLGWTITDLAKAAGVSYPTAHGIEHGANAYPSTLDKVQAALEAEGVTVLARPLEGASRPRE